MREQIRASCRFTVNLLSSDLLVGSHNGSEEKKICQKKKTNDVAG